MSACLCCWTPMIHVLEREPCSMTRLWNTSICFLTNKSGIGVPQLVTLKVKALVAVWKCALVVCEWLALLGKYYLSIIDRYGWECLLPVLKAIWTQSYSQIFCDKYQLKVAMLWVRTRSALNNSVKQCEINLKRVSCWSFFLKFPIYFIF